MCWTSAGCLIEQLSEEKYECMVCCDVIRLMAPVWSCQSCFHVFHLNCIKKWARSPASQADGTAPRAAPRHFFLRGGADLDCGQCGPLWRGCETMGLHSAVTLCRQHCTKVAIVARVTNTFHQHSCCLNSVTLQ